MGGYAHGDSSVSDEIAGYWDEYAAAYDAEPDHGLGDPSTREAWRVLLQRWLPEQPSDIADLACGTGSLTALVAGLGHCVVGVDLVGNMVERARAKTVQFADMVTIKQGDEDYNDDSRMPWAGGVRSADLVAALESLVQRIEVLPLTDPVLWGKQISDERYLLVADL